MSADTSAPASAGAATGCQDRPGSGGYRHVGVLIAAQAAGQTGSWASLVVAVPLALGHRHPATWLAVITAAWAGPAMLSSAAGRPIDRFGPRLAGTAAWLGAAAGAVAALAVRQLPGLVIALAVISACRGAEIAAGDTAPTWMPDRPDLTRAGSWLMLAAAVPLLAGPLGAAALLTFFGPPTAWITVAALFAAGAAGSMAVPAARPASPGSRPKITRGRGRLMAVLITQAVVWVSYGSMSVLQPLYVQDTLHSSLIVYGWTLFAFAAGIAGRRSSARTGSRESSDRS